jgi:hypothetical protein
VEPAGREVATARDEGEEEEGDDRARDEGEEEEGDEKQLRNTVQLQDGLSQRLALLHHNRGAVAEWQGRQRGRG